MRQMRRGTVYSPVNTLRQLTYHSPLKPDELNVLRAQYEKEGEYVGVQTKFNYAWVGPTSWLDVEDRWC